MGEKRTEKRHFIARKKGKNVGALRTGDFWEKNGG